MLWFILKKFATLKYSKKYIDDEKKKNCSENFELMKLLKC